MSGLTVLEYSFKLHPRGGHEINFQMARQDTTSVANKQFNAWLADDGSHIIMERNLADTENMTTKYFFAKTGFADNWTGRAGLDYVEYNALF